MKKELAKTTLSKEPTTIVNNIVALRGAGMKLVDQTLKYRRLLRPSSQPAPNKKTRKRKRKRPHHTSIDKYYSPHLTF
jgi:hypothetical protein